MSVDSHGNSRPIPDPTVLTSEQITREIRALKEIVDVRFESMALADQLRRDKLDAIYPVEIEKLIQHLEKLLEQKFVTVHEKFSGVSRQFIERDTRTDQSAIASGAALAAALQAAKELTGAQGEASAAAAVKSETSVTKQIDAIGVIISTLEKALDSRITELKERIDRNEGTSLGARSYRDESRMNSSLITAILGAVFVGIGIVITVFIAFNK